MFFVKLVLSALLITAASEVAKRSVLAASLLVSLPLSSLIALSFLYYDTRDTAKVASFSQGIFWGVLPSLFFLLLLPVLLRSGMRFIPAMTIACVAMSGAYTLYVLVLTHWGIEL